MSIIRSIIESANRTLCFVRRLQKNVAVSASDPTKINLGCGLAVAPGWINIDGSLNALFSTWPRPCIKFLYNISGAKQYYASSEYCRLLTNHRFVHYDLVYGIPFEAKSADFIYSSHFLEHLHKKEAVKLLRECARVLKPTGILRISVPDLSHAISLYGMGEKQKMLTSYFFVEDRESTMARHKYMYDFELLRHALLEAGFSEVERCAFRKGKTPDLDILDNRPEDSLFVEASLQ